MKERKIDCGKPEKCKDECSKLEALERLVEEINQWAKKNKFQYCKLEIAIGKNIITNMKIIKSLIPKEG